MDPHQDFDIDRIALTHGQARHVLAHLDLRAGENDKRFDAYLKSLRRDGLPFAKDEMGVGAGHNLVYRFEHLMELAVALALRAQAILARDIVAVLARERDVLRPLYRRAWLERESDLGKKHKVTIKGAKPIQASGVYLDLLMSYDKFGLLRYVEPTLLGPPEAIERFCAQYLLLRPRPPIPVSQLAIDIVPLAQGAPEIKRGRR